MTAFSRYLITLGVFLGALMGVGASDRGKFRSNMEAAVKQGNWKEAFEIYERDLLGVDDDKSWEDLRTGVKSLRKLNKMTLLDDLIEKAVARCPKNVGLLIGAGVELRSASDWGMILDGEFRRNEFRGGRQVTAKERDRVRSMQLFLKALEHAKTDQQKVRAFAQLSESLTEDRLSRGSFWALGQLTSVDVLPDYGDGRGLYSGSGAPVDRAGKVVYFDVPGGWEAAKNDGERWRWLIGEISRLDPKRKNGVEENWANTMRRIYGVGTLGGYRGWYGRDDEESQKGILQTGTLGEGETIAKLANGVKRFELRKDYRFIPIYRRLYQQEKVGSAGDSLVQVFLDRRQYVAAAKELRQVMEICGDDESKSRAKLLDQITGDWGRFEPVSMFMAGVEPQVPFLFRNAKSVDCELYEVKMDLLLEDVMTYFEGNPESVDWRKSRLGSFGELLVGQERKRYLGEKLVDWNQELKPEKELLSAMAMIEVPGKKAGAYLLKARAGNGNDSWMVIWISDSVLLSQQTKDHRVFYFGDAKAGDGLAGEVEFFGYHQKYLKKRVGNRRYEVKTKRFKKEVGPDGVLKIAKGELSKDFQWMVIARGQGERKAFLGFDHFYWGDFQYDHLQQKRAFGLSDRPVYRPGQEVKVKFWARSARYDQNEKSIYAGKVFDVMIQDRDGQKVMEAKALVADEYGGLETSWVIPEDGKLGQYQVSLKGEVGGWLSFRVEEYKKPEYEVLVSGPKEPIALGEEFEAEVKAKYYHGAPVTEAKVKVKVMRYSHSERWYPSDRWDWLYGGGYWWFGQDYEWYPGWHKWGCVCPPRGPEFDWRRRVPGELVMEREYEIGADGVVKVKVDTSVAKLVHGDLDHRYEVTAEVVDASRRTIVGQGNVLAGRQMFQVTTWLDRGWMRPGEPGKLTYIAQTLNRKPVKGEVALKLWRVQLDEKGEVQEELVKEWEGETTDGGRGELEFEVPKAGQYRISAVVKDGKGNEAEGATVFVVKGEKNEGGGGMFNDLEVVVEKKVYAPGDSAKVLIQTSEPDSTVLLFVRGSGHVAEKLEVIRMKGKSHEFELKLEKRDLPNMFVYAMAISRGRVVSKMREIFLPPVKRILNVEVIPEKEKYGPGDEGKVKVRLTDENGEPFVGSTAVTVYDKSLESISGGSNVPKIEQFFWNHKRSFYPSYRGVYSQTKGESPVYDPNKERMRDLGKFGAMVATRYLFESLGEESRKSGDPGRRSKFAARGQNNSARMSGMVMLAEAQSFKENAGGGGGHESGSGVKVTVRSEFADLVKWVGALETDEKGEAVIDLEMPDNLTTWKVKTWAVGQGTRVGEGSAELIVSKDLLIRLQAPRFFVEGDEVVLSGIVHNYHEEAKEVEVSLELDGGTVEAVGGLSSVVVIPAGGEKRVEWKVVAKAEGEVTVRMKAVASDDADAMEKVFPVYVHGMEKTDSWSRAIAPEGHSAKIEFEVPEKRRPSETRLEVRYSPTIATAMVDALPYLVSYPYGCTEQTLNRFVPTVVTQKVLKEMGVDLLAVKNKRVNLNPQEIGDAKERAEQWRQWKNNPVWDQDEVEKMVGDGIARLVEMQNNDGGWGWFSGYGERSYPHTTAVVVHGLILAKENGASLPKGILDRGVKWLKKFEEKEADRLRHWKKREKNTKEKASAMDVMVREILGKAGVDHKEMLGYLIRDRVGLPVYAKCLLGLELHRLNRVTERDAVLRNVEQFLVKDPENQSAYLDLRNGGYWWYWYGNEFEAHATYLKLLSVVKPKSEEARGVVKYLVNNRKNATYWRSTRDTAFCLEALAGYLRASGEMSPDLEVEVLLDGRSLKTVKISKENLFSFDGTVVVEGDVLGAGKHVIELKKKGEGPLYANAYLKVFSLEDFIKKAGLEVKVERAFYKLEPVDASEGVAGSRGQALTQKKEKFRRVALRSGDEVKSGDLIEVELSIESKNDYTYLVFEDWKAAGLEPVEVRSGYHRNGLGAFMEMRDERVAMFVRSLPRGRHNLSYRLRAEIPGKFSALPTRAEAMYAPELRGNSNEMKIRVAD